ncbi:MAG: OmpH family outer membrane protein [Lachnospiraceae bacterium]|nr:OmpH family outer membrane protein [Lachnospiraceae bacterium]
MKRQKIIEKKGTGRLQDLQKKLDASAGEKFRDLQEKLEAGAGEKFRDLQEKINTETGEKLQKLQERIGDRAENAIGSVIENSRLKAPELSVGPGEPGAEAPALFVRPGRGPGFEIPERKPMSGTVCRWKGERLLTGLHIIFMCAKVLPIIFASSCPAGGSHGIHIRLPGR